MDAGLKIKGIAHITGGGFLENIPRILPRNVSAYIEKGSWEVLPIFKLLQKIGDVSETEMYRTFNMGIGMILILPANTFQRIKTILDGNYQDYKVFEIGKIVERPSQVILN
jgi:phosphoribosylformylglycinamidine cyclo-ligase